jgi:hypothetical protein
MPADQLFAKRSRSAPALNRSGQVHIDSVNNFLREKPAPDLLLEHK